MLSLESYLIVSVIYFPGFFQRSAPHTGEINQKPTTIKCIRFIRSAASHIVASSVIKDRGGAHDKGRVRGGSTSEVKQETHSRFYECVLTADGQNYVFM